MDDNDPFSYLHYFLHRRRERDCEVYTFYTKAGRPQLDAEVKGIPEDISFRRPGRTGMPLLVLKAWQYFSVNGKYDVLEYDGGPRVGIVHRAGNLYDDQEKVLGHISDPAPAGEPVKGGMIRAVAKAVLSGDDESGYSRQPEMLQLLVGRDVAAVFHEEKLPFAVPGDKEEFSPAKLLQGFLPPKAQAAMEDFTEPRAWRLDFSTEAAVRLDPRLRVAAALFHIELKRASGR
jgi:hypothetical protein